MLLSLKPINQIVRWQVAKVPHCFSSFCSSQASIQQLGRLRSQAFINATSAHPRDHQSCANPLQPAGHTSTTSASITEMCKSHHHIYMTCSHQDSNTGSSTQFIHTALPCSVCWLALGWFFPLVSWIFFHGILNGRWVPKFSVLTLAPYCKLYTHRD